MKYATQKKRRLIVITMGLLVFLMIAGCSIAISALNKEASKEETVGLDIEPVRDEVTTTIPVTITT